MRRSRRLAGKGPAPPVAKRGKKNGTGANSGGKKKLGGMNAEKKVKTKARKETRVKRRKTASRLLLSHQQKKQETKNRPQPP